MLIFYYSLIKYDMSTAERYVKRYQKKLLRLNYCLMRPSRRLDDGLLQLDSVALTVDLSRTRFCAITGITLNYEEHLGKKPRHQVLGSSLNSLLPPAFVREHRRYLETMDGFETKVNRQRLLLLFDFDSNLRHATGLVKVLPCLEQSVAAAALLTFEAEKQSSLLLLDAQGSLLGFDHAMKATLLRCGLVSPSPATTQLEDFGENLRSSAKLLGLYHGLRAETFTPDAEENTDFRKKFAKLMEEVYGLATTKGIKFQPEPFSLLHQHLGHKEICVRFEFRQLFGRELTFLLFKKADLKPSKSGRQLLGCSAGSESLTDSNDDSHVANAPDRLWEDLDDAEEDLKNIDSSLLADRHDLGKLSYHNLIEPVARFVEEQALAKSPRPAFRLEDFGLGVLSSYLADLFADQCPSVQEMVHLVAQNSHFPAKSQRTSQRNIAADRRSDPPLNHKATTLHSATDPIALSELVEFQTTSNLPPKADRKTAFTQDAPRNTAEESSKHRGSLASIGQKKRELSVESPGSKPPDATKQHKSGKTILTQPASTNPGVAAGSGVQQSLPMASERKNLVTGRSVRLDPSTKQSVKIASSKNLASLIMKLTVASCEQKKEHFVADRGTGDNESISSSIFSVSGTTTKLVMKNIGLRLNASPKTGKLLFVAALSLYMVCFSVYSGETISRDASAFIRSSTSVFKVYSSYAQLDASFARSLQTFVDRLFTLTSLLYPQLWSAQLSPGELLLRQAESQAIHEQLQRQAGGVSPLQRIARDLRKAGDHFADRFEHLLLQQQDISAIPPDLYLEFVSVRANLTVYQPDSYNPLSSYSLSIFSFNPLFKAQLDFLVLDIEAVLAADPDPRPPFDLDQRFLEDFRAKFTRRFNVIKTGLDSIAPANSAILRSFTEQATSNRMKQYLLKTQASLAVFGLLFGAFLAACAYLACKTNDELLRLVAQYDSLRSNEVEILRELAAERADFFKACLLDELKMVSKYKHTTHFGFVDPREAEYKNFKVRDAMSSKLKRSVKLGRRHLFASTKLLLAAMAVSAVFFAVFVALVVLETRVMRFSTGAVELFARTYEQFTHVSDYYTRHLLYLSYGNYFRDSGRPMLESIKQFDSVRPVDNLLGHLMDHAEDFAHYFGADFAAEIHSLLHVSVCSAIDPSVSDFEFEAETCASSLEATQGLIAFMQLEADYFTKMRESLAAESSFNELSQTRPNLMLFQASLFEENIIRERRLHEIVFFEISLDLIMRAGIARVEFELGRIATFISNLNRLTHLSSWLIFSSVFCLLVRSFVKRDLAVCAETIRNTLPEIVLHNKLVYRVFNELFPIIY